MTKDEIISMLTRLLGPFKIKPQEADSHFDKFQDILRQALTQPTLAVRKSGIHFQDFETNMLPDSINRELEKLAGEIVTAQAARTPKDPVFWIRERNLPVTAGLEENPENYLEAEFSFGPFVNQQLKQSWFDFYRVPKQLNFDMLFAGMPAFLVITLQLDDPLPAQGSHNSLSFDDCCVWINVKNILPAGDKKYAGLRAKHCVISAPAPMAVQSNGFATFMSNNFEISLLPFDSFANGIENNAQPKIEYPGKIVCSFANGQWSFNFTGESAINLNGDSIRLEESSNIHPVYLDPDRLLHVPVPANKDSWEINGNDSERATLYGKARITDTGWYFPVINSDTTLGMGMLGMLFFSGYAGFRGQEGISLDWPGLENGKLQINKFLVLARPGRMTLHYTFAARSRIKQQLSTWKAKSGGEARSLINLKPPGEGEGIFLTDNQDMEALIQPVTITARADQPLNANQQRFEISGHEGLVLFLKIKSDNSVYIIGTRPPPAAGAVRKRRIPQSLCLRNALLTTDDPASIFVEGRLLSNEFIREGFFNLVFPVYRLVNTLPDPYISNQDEIFNEEFLRFNELWRTGQDTLPEQFLFSVTSIVQWNDEGTSLRFNLNQPSAINRIDDGELFNMFIGIRHLCSSLRGDGNGFPGEDIHKIKSFDLENVIGSYGYLQWTPGNRTLVDVSGSANQWGVAFAVTIPQENRMLAESLGYSASFPFRFRNMDMVSSGRLARLFTLPHIQWEPVMKIENPSVPENDIPAIINFSNNGAPTRISSAKKNEVELVPRNMYNFIVDGFNSAEKPYGVAAQFNLPFGICAVAYFNPKKVEVLPHALARINEPAFSDKKLGEISGGMQMHFEAVPPPGAVISATDNHLAYFIGSARQLPIANSNTVTILGSKITPQFNKEFTEGMNAKVPLQRIDFSGYGASLFSNWLNEKANFGRVNQVKFDVMIGRTAHEVIQVRSILFPWGVPVVRSIVIQRKNTGTVTRYDSGWVAQGPGEFDFLSHATGMNLENNPYNFHPGMVTGIYNVSEIRDIPEEMDIILTNLANVKIRLTGVYFNGDIQMENVIKGALPKTPAATLPRVHSVNQFGYVMLADPAQVSDSTSLHTLFPPDLFKKLLNHPNVGGSLGGPVDCVMNIAATGQRLHVTRVDISASNEANVTFVVSVRGTVELPKEGSWTVVKCLPSKDIVTLNQAEAVPMIRNGLLLIKRNGTTVTRNIQFSGSHHAMGDPKEIDKYAPAAAVPALQYGFLQTTDTQKLLFRRPSFSAGAAQKIFTDIPDLADSFRLLDCNTIFPNLSKTLSLPNNVRELLITGEGNGLKLADALFEGAVSLKNFVPPQLSVPGSQIFKLIDEPAFKVFIRYGSVAEPSTFQVDMNSDAGEEPAEGDRKKWEMINKNVSIEVHLGPLKPILTITGQFHSEAGKKPVFEKPVLEFGPQLKTVTDILQVLALLSGQGNDVFADNLKVAMGNSADSWSYKMSIEQRIPVIQFPNTATITMSTPPPLVIEASLLLGAFFNLSLSPDPKNLIKPGAGAVFGFEGMIQILLLSIGVAAAYGVGITKVKAYVDITDPAPSFEFTFGFGATVVVVLPVVGMVSVTRSVDITGSVDKDLLILAGQMLRGVLSLAGGLLMVAVQIEGRGGVQKSAGSSDTVALFEVIFSLDVGLAFVVKYNFTKRWREEVTLSSPI